MSKQGAGKTLTEPSIAKPEIARAVITKPEIAKAVINRSVFSFQHPTQYAAPASGLGRKAAAAAGTRRCTKGDASRGADGDGETRKSPLMKSGLSGSADDDARRYTMLSKSMLSKLSGASA